MEPICTAWTLLRYQILRSSHHEWHCNGAENDEGNESGFVIIFNVIIVVVNDEEQHSNEICQGQGYEHVDLNESNKQKAMRKSWMHSCLYSYEHQFRLEELSFKDHRNCEETRKEF